jgi:hypothetical protein
MHQSDSCSTSAGKSNAVSSVLKSSDTCLKGMSSWVSTSGVIKLVEWHTDVLLSIGGAKMNWYIDTTEDLLRLLSFVNGEC